MEKNSVKGQVNINATPEKIWNVLTNPEKIILYTGSKANTDWLEGSPITWSGEMHGVPYSNKGEILKIEPNTQLKHTFWTGIGGDKDMPEHYSEVSFTLNEKDNQTVELTYLRTDIATEAETQMFRMHIQSMLGEIKKLSEE